MQKQNQSKLKTQNLEQAASFCVLKSLTSVQTLTHIVTAQDNAKAHIFAVFFSLIG